MTPPAPTLWESVLGGADDARSTVRVGDDACSRAELTGRAAAVAASLQADLAPGEPVAVHAEPGVATLTAVVAGILAGRPVVPVPPDSGDLERRHVLTDSGATAWIGPASLAPGLRHLDVADAGSPAGTLEPVDGSHPALVLYTSGTTGSPKGVEMSGDVLTAGLDALAEAWEWTPDDTLVHGLPLFHLHGLVLGVLGALRVGSSLVHTVRPSPSAYAAAGGSLYFGVPTVWQRLVNEPASAHALRRARALVSGSAPLPLRTFTALQQATGLTPVERYGMTETGITLSNRTDRSRRPGWVGLPLGDVEARLRDEADAPVPSDGATPGRLEVRGPTVMPGYVGRADATREAFTDDGWFRTGDVAVRDASGEYRIVGRESTDLIKTGGYRVGAGEVEAVLIDHPAVHEAAVVGRPDEDLGQVVVAYVVADAGPTLSDDLVALVAQRLSHHKRPRAVVLVDELPRNHLGKVLKNLLT